MPSQPRDAGETLLEIVIAVMIMGLGTTAILGAMGTSIGLSRVHRQQVVTGRLLDNLVEYMKNEATAPYTPCPTAVTAYTADLGVFKTFVKTTTTSTVYEPDVDQFSFSVDVSSPLPAPAVGDSVTFAAGGCAGNEQGLQQLTLTVAHVDGKSATTVQVTKWLR